MLDGIPRRTGDLGVEPPTKLALAYTYDSPGGGQHGSAIGRFTELLWSLVTMSLSAVICLIAVTKAVDVVINRIQSRREF